MVDAAMMKRMRRILRMLIDSMPLTADVGSTGNDLVRQELLAEGVTRRLLALTGHPLLGLASTSSCGTAVLRRLLQYLDDHPGDLSLDRFRELAHVAVVIAERIKPCAPALRVRAWQKKGTALARKGLFNDAEAAFDAAGSYVPDTHTPEYYGAILALARAIAHHSKRRPDKATGLLPGLADVFDKYADTTRARYARQLHAILLQHLGRLEEALAQYNAVESLVERAGSRYELAVLRMNIATCHIENGDVAAGQPYCDAALPVLISLGQHEAVARLERALARRDADSNRLLEIGRKFLKHGALGEYIITYLDALEATLEGNPEANVKDICEDIVAQAAICGLERHVVARLIAMQSLASRRELRAADVVTIRSDVSDFLKDLRAIVN